MKNSQNNVTDEVLVDSCVWIEFLRKTNSPASLQLSKLIDDGRVVLSG